MVQNPLDRLLQTLGEHDIDLGRDDVEWAFDSHQAQTETTSWVDEHLTTSTLLSKEELEM